MGRLRQGRSQPQIVSRSGVSRGCPAREGVAEGRGARLAARTHLGARRRLGTAGLESARPRLHWWRRLRGRHPGAGPGAGAGRPGWPRGREADPGPPRAPELGGAGPRLSHTGRRRALPTPHFLLGSQGVERRRADGAAGPRGIPRHPIQTPVERIYPVGKGIRSPPRLPLPGLEGAAQTTGAARRTGIGAGWDCGDAHARGGRGCPSGRSGEPTRGASPPPLG